MDLARDRAMLDAVDTLGPITGCVYRLWLGLRPAPDLLPGRRHFDPASLTGETLSILPHLWLMDVERSDGAPLRFRYRLIGGALVTAGILAKRGDYLHAFDHGGQVARRFEEVCATRQPSFRRGRPVLPHARQILELETLALPLASDGVTVDMLLNCTVYHWQLPARQPAPGIGFRYPAADAAC